MAFDTKRSQWHRAQAARAPPVCFGISMARGEKCTCTVQIISASLSFFVICLNPDMKMKTLGTHTGDWKTELSNP